MSATAGAARPFDALHRRALRPAPDPALSARFLPARLVAEDEAQAARFRALARGFGRDSTRHFSFRGRNLEVSHDLLAAIAGTSEPHARTGPGSTSAGAARPSGFAAYLALRHGLRFRAVGSLHAAYSPDDERYRGGPQWALRNDGGQVAGLAAKAGVDIRMEPVWDRFAGADTLVVAVLDAGFAFGHPDLAGRHWINRAEAEGAPGMDDDGNGFVDDSTGWDFVDGDNRPEDAHGHGAFISGVLAAGFDDGRGMAGMLAQGKVMAVRVLDASGHGDQQQIADGILYALRNGAHVINFSIGGGGSLPALVDAFREARDRDVPIVAAAGNEGLDVDAQAVFPSSLDFGNLVVVGSHGPAGALSSFSNHGDRVHIAAPGEAILTCGLPDRIEAWSEDFEDAGAASRWTLSSGMGVTSVEPLEGTRSLAWSSGASAAAAMADTLDLSGKEGAVVAFALRYVPADATDRLILEGNRAGSATWTEVAVIGEEVPAGTRLEFALRSLDGGKVRLRFRTSIQPGRSTAARRLRVDDLSVTLPDPAPATRDVHVMVDGTSLSAPHVAAYVGLQRLACDRMGLAWTRARALQGLVTDPILAGKVLTGGRLDAEAGLAFYLETLPDLVVRDSNVLSLTDGEAVAYDLEVVGPGNAGDYRFFASGLGSGMELDAAEGRLTWVATSPGIHDLKLVAEGPTQLRRRMALEVVPAGPVAKGPRGDRDGAIRIGKRLYRLPRDLGPGLHRFEITGMDARGRSRALGSGWVDARHGFPSFDLGRESASFPLLRVRLDGRGLEPLFPR
jgi:hypothetical protein